MGTQQLLMGDQGNAFVPVTHTYTTGSGATETIPAGASFLTIKLGGGGGSGGANSVDGGSGGGGAGYCASDGVAVSGGLTLIYTVGQGGAAVTGDAQQGNAGFGSTVSSGTQSITTMNANGGAGGQGITPFDGGTGGLAAGGTTSNITGGAGGAGGGGTQAGGIAAGGFPGDGSAGVYGYRSAQPGDAGQVSFSYT